MSLREEVSKAAGLKVFFARHALDQMNKPDRMISDDEVRRVVMEGEEWDSALKVRR